MTKDFTYEQILLNQMHIPTRLMTSYKQLHLNETEVMLILHIHRFLQDNITFPTPTELAEVLTVDEGSCANLLRKLIQKGFLEINQITNEHNQLSEAYSLEPLWKKLFTNKKGEQPVDEDERTIFILFEQEFGRLLSPFEIETINAWLDEDKIIPSLIKAG